MTRVRQSRKTESLAGRRRSAGPAAAIAVLALIFASPAAREIGAAEEESGSDDRLRQHLTVFSEVISLIRRAYVEEVPLERLFAGALDGVTDALGRASIYVPATGREAFERARQIGAGRSGVHLAKERGIAYLVAVDPGSPGAAAGLASGDILTEIQGAATRQMPLWRLLALLAGEPGTELALEILRRGQPLETTLTLAEYPPPQPRLERHGEIPLIRPGRIDGDSAAALREMLAGLASAGEERLVVDLRGTAAGEPAGAYEAGGLFAAGELGRLVRRGEVVESFTAREPPIWSGRLVVLADRATQGTAEILAQILVQRAGAELVGERTFGHAGRERVVEFSNGARLVSTDAFYTGPDGELIDRGLEPAVRVSAASARLEEADLDLAELVLRRGLERLREGGGR